MVTDNNAVRALGQGGNRSETGMNRSGADFVRIQIRAYGAVVKQAAFQKTEHVSGTEFIRAEYVVINPVFHIHGFPCIGMAEGGLKE